MKWGVFLIAPARPEDSQHEVLQNALAYALAAEKGGYEEAWVLEHHFTGYGLCGAPLAMSAYILGATKRLKVGTAVSVIPLDHPVRLAESVALLDNLSKGRLLFGISRGQFVKDYKVFGVDMETNRERMEEGLDLMLKAWRDGHVGADSQFYRFDDVPVMPAVFTKPNPAVYAAVYSPTSVEWAARNAIPLLLSHIQDDEARRGLLDLYNEVAVEHGHDPDTIDHAIACLAGVGHTTEEVCDASRPRLLWWQEEFFRASELYKDGNMNMRGHEWYARLWEKEAIGGGFDSAGRVERYMKSNPIGSVQECIDRLNKTVEVTGVGHFICGFESVSGSSGRVLESMMRFKEEVIPHVASPVPRSRR